MATHRPSDETLAAHRTIEITTVGRRTRQSRRIEIWWFYVEGRFFITGTPGARDWYANVLDHPGITIHVAGWDRQATARVVSDVETRALVFDSPFTRWYASQSQRISLIEEAPMIEIVF